LPTSFREQEELVARLFELFPEPPNDVIVDAQSAQELRSTIDRVVHFYFYLTEKWPDRIDLANEDLDYQQLDITAYMQCMWRTRVSVGVVGLLRERSQNFIWVSFPNPASLRDEYLRVYELFGKPSASLSDRYHHLIVLAKLQILFLGSTFI
jgi:hypothetical protein